MDLPPRCPLCTAIGAVEAVPGGGVVCARCGWNPEALRPAGETIPTWKFLVPLVVPFALLNASIALSENKKGTDTPASLLCFGLGFLLVGIWSGVSFHFWERTSDRYKSAWRPSSALTPALLAVVFSIGGLVLSAQALLKILGP